MIFWDNVKSLFNTGSQCVFCGTELPLGEKICSACSEQEKKLRKVRTAENGAAYIYAYDGIVRGLLHSLKYNDNISGAYYAAEVMTKELNTFNIDFKNSILTNVPIHKDRLRTRGFDQCAVIAKRIADLSGIRYLKLFERVKKTKAQFKLNAEERAENMKDAFRLIYNAGLSGKTVILIDDICTTGITLNECIKLLSENINPFPYVFAYENI